MLRAAELIRHARDITDGLSKSDYQYLADIADELEKIAERGTSPKVMVRTHKPKYRIGISGDIEEIKTLP